MEFDAGPQSGKRVIEAAGLCKSFGDKQIVLRFSICVCCVADRVAFVGPNGGGQDHVAEKC